MKKLAALLFLLWASTAQAANLDWTGVPSHKPPFVFAPTGRIVLAWDANVQPIFAGYRVYIGTSTGTYTRVDDVRTVTQYAINGLAFGTTYYLAVSSYDTEANESVLSPEVVTVPK